jgi:phosphate transport system ATP-binding protein
MVTGKGPLDLTMDSEENKVSKSSRPGPPVPVPGRVPAPDGDGVSPDEGSSGEELKAEVINLSFWYGSLQALKKINLPVRRHQVTALIGPSGCGKSTLLRCFNRMHDLYPKTRHEGEIVVHPGRVNVLSPKVDPIEVRMRISMVFQKPNPFPKSIYENVAFGLRLRGIGRKSELDEQVTVALEGAALWEEVKDRLNRPAYNLSGGQQQRLCIARALAANPEMVLFDEPTSALDPSATTKIEELIYSLRDRVTMLIVTHNMQQASRVSDYTGFLYLGELVELDETARMFTNPRNKLTEEYITGRFG